MKGGFRYTISQDAVTGRTRKDTSSHAPMMRIRLVVVNPCDEINYKTPVQAASATGRPTEIAIGSFSVAADAGAVPATSR